MWIQKKLLIIIFSGFFAGLHSKADSQSSPVHISADTTRNDSFINQKALNDPRRAFKDLFISSPEKTDNYSVQLNPRAISFVQDYMITHTKQLEQMKGWGKPYFDLMEEILNAHGLPGELKYLAVIESDLRSSALSWAGAMGPWQFMPGTARRMGLKVGPYLDDRTDYYKSTNAAARYLKELFSIYGDWLLVIAAYDGGNGNVDHAIRKSGSHNFWNLQYYLPEESRNHVKKFIATHYIMEGNGGITTVTKDEAKDIVTAANGKSLLSADELQNCKVQTISGKYKSIIIAKNILMDVASFNRYNPNFDKQIAVNGTFDLRLPADKMDVFNAKKYEILEESLRLLLAAVNDGGK
ncbi:MAG TPA: lytic transglycosylase domain-containing protein [Chitinophagaceae bacterium]|nr:lytic transglycosylase domain-containing protein [Chitinophagaceae bacterium]